MLCGWVAGVAGGLGTRVDPLLPHRLPLPTPTGQRPSPGRPYLAGVLALVQSCAQHVVGEDAGVEDLTLPGAQDADPGAAQALVVFH